MTDPTSITPADVVELQTQLVKRYVHVPEECIIIQWLLLTVNEGNKWFLGLSLPTSRPCHYDPTFYGSSLSDVVQQALTWLRNAG